MAGKEKVVTSLEEYRQGLRDDWNVYVANKPIDLDGGIRAFNVGDAVPASHVDRGVVHPDDVTLRSDLDESGELPGTPVVVKHELRGGASSLPPEPESIKETAKSGDK